MQVIQSHRIVYCDVDDTLVIWDWKPIDPDGNNLITVRDPKSGHSEHVMPHNRHIQLVKQFKARGHTVVVWSQGGWSWAESVVRALGLVDVVDLVMDKPSWYIDDLPASAFMTRNIYLDPVNPLKDKSSWVTVEEEDEKD
jgi:hypothetical protein